MDDEQCLALDDLAPLRLLPAAGRFGYFGAKKANEPLHIQYSYDDRSVVVVNYFYHDFKVCVATAIYNLDMAESSRGRPMDVAPNASQRVFTLPEPAGLTSTYLCPHAGDAAGKPVSRNFYWLSTQPDTMGEPKDGSDWYYTPTDSSPISAALNTLPPAAVRSRQLRTPRARTKSHR